MLLFRLQSKSSIRSLLIKLNDKVFKFKKVTCLFISTVELYVPLTKLTNLRGKVSGCCKNLQDLLPAFRAISPHWREVSRGCNVSFHRIWPLEIHKEFKLLFLVLSKGLCYVRQQGSKLWGCSGWWQRGKQGRATPSPATLRTSAPVSVQLLGVIPTLFPSGFAPYQQWTSMAIFTNVKYFSHTWNSIFLCSPSAPGMTLKTIFQWEAVSLSDLTDLTQNGLCL